METILKKFGYSSSLVKESQSCTKLELLFINNPDQSIRWVWSSSCKKPIFLKFYNIGSIRARLFAMAIQIVFILRLQKVIFHKKYFFFTKIATPIFDYTKDWTLFMGTIGLNNKAILYTNNSFYKIATTKSAQKMITTERKILGKLQMKQTKFIIPKATYINKDIIQLTDISANGKRTKTFTPSHLKALIETSLIEKKIIKVDQWSLFNTLKRKFENSTDKRIPKNIVRKLNTLIQNCSPNKEVETHLSQGDFTQWNMYKTKNKKIAIYDWELASFERPKGYDYFHYIIQQGILVERKSWKHIYQDILKFSENKFGDSLFDLNLNEYLKWYLIINCMYNIQIYADQIKWYKQIYWMFQVWNEALNLFVEQHYNQRELIIMDLFDFLETQDYAALKYPKGYPEDLSIDSDIDLVIDQKNNKTIVKHLRNHSLVSKISINQKSFMNTIQVFTTEGSILSIDLIWQLKIKNYEILSAKEIIAKNYKNNYGAKNASEIDTARFVILFYTLNKSKIPEKYLDYKKAIENSNEYLDLILQEYFNNGCIDCLNIKSFVRQKKENKSLSFIKNTVNYFADTIKNITHNKGFTITFSGVDGAGKSTVIDLLAYKIEKQLRKPVVILRHRPSILPILSVWTKGKKKAHKDATDNLPRQGANISLISSFFRFSYYYLDYLIGQFFIYFKYILRGYVVLYDRYYFDFISDGKRSNIILSKKIPSFGYQFLMEPKFNFFLFAEASVILNRKKELSKITIEQLTNDYKKLFTKLKAKKHSAVYECINNTDIDITINHIVTTIIQNKK
jgi:thymidylate kinase